MERHTAVVTLRELLKYVMETIDEMKSWDISDARKKANSLESSICQTDFVVPLIILERISGLMLPATRALQTVGTDLVEAMTLISHLLTV